MADWAADDLPGGHADADPPRGCEVVVVGAGLAGLAAARTLAADGVDVLVLEAGAVPGGRVATDVVDGWRCDRGFQLLNPAYPVLADFVDIADLHLQAFGVGAVAWTPTGRVSLPDPRRQPFTLLRGLAAVTDARELAALARSLVRAVALPAARLESGPDRGWHEALDAAGLDGGLRRQVLEPFLTGTLADPDGVTSRRFVDLVLRSFVLAALTRAPGLPADGMRALPAGVAAPVADRLHTGVRVTGVRRDTDGIEVTWVPASGESHAEGTGGRALRARAAVVACDPVTAGHLLARTRPAMHALTTWWHVTDSPAVEERRARYLHVDGTGGHRRDGGLVNTAVISRAAPSYRAPGAPAGQDLVATTRLGAHAGSSEEAVTRRWAGEVLGADPGGWRLLTTHVIPGALPVASAPLEVRRPVDLGDGLFVAGDHRDTPSIQGALVSGRRAARALLRRFGVAPGGARHVATETLEADRAR